jgi:predicted secreted hydrolase
VRHILIAVGSALLVLAGSIASGTVDYPVVEASRPIVFPADEGAHPEFRTEWWYLTGLLDDDAGRSLGFQITFFRTRPGVDEANPSKFAPRQLLFAHAAVSDARQGRLLRGERVARAGFGLAEARTGALDVSIDDWRLHRDGDVYETAIATPRFSLELRLRATREPVLHGNAGVSRKSPDAGYASYYYSLPQLVTEGRIVIDGKEHRVRGTAWFDHEWWSSLLDDTTYGWDWTGLNFDDGSALMAMRMRDERGAQRWSLITWVPAKTREGSPAPQSTEGAAVTWTALRRWRSTQTGTDYPVEWKLDVAGRTIVLRPTMDDQENDTRGSTGTLYWEGAVRAFDAGNRPIGRGYLELTGYGSRLRL